MSQLRLAAMLLLTVFLAHSATAFTVTVSNARTVVSRSAIYDYAPTIIRQTTGQTDCWYCGGQWTANGSPYNDVILHTTNWNTSSIELCPSEGGYTNCPGNTTAGDDKYHVCDPSVVHVGSTYYMYYTAPKWLGEASDAGADNQIFLATSVDGRAWSKYVDSTGRPIPVRAKPQNTDRYGIGEASVVYVSGTFYMYYSDKPWWSETYIRRATSTNGKTFGVGIAITPGNTMPTGMNNVDVKYIPGWKTWLMVTDRADRSGFVYNVSRDGLHWVPYGKAQSFRVPYSYATQMALVGDRYGHIGTGSLTSTQRTSVVFAGGASSDPLAWDLQSVDLVLSPERLTGHLDGVDGNKVAYGWAYDADTGINDAAAKGSPTAPLGHDTWVRAVLVSNGSGTRYESAWQSAALSRPDLVSAGAAPDQYHGFRIDLKGVSVPAGTYTVRVEGGEFPTGMGATELSGGPYTVVLP